VHDVDTGEAVFQTPTAPSLQGTYGAFTFNATTGDWTYTLDNNSPLVQALPADAQVTDAMTATSSDVNASHAIVITITSTHDAATITGTATGSVVEDDATQNVASGSLTVHDVDTGEAVFQTPTAPSLQGTYGAFTFNATTGDWTYTLDNNSPLVQALPAGAQV